MRRPRNSTKSSRENDPKNNNGLPLEGPINFHQSQKRPPISKEDLPALVQRANDWRRMTGAGVSFLSIPRSYYGSLNLKPLVLRAGPKQREAEKGKRSYTIVLKEHCQLSAISTVKATRLTR